MQLCFTEYIKINVQARETSCSCSFHVFSLCHHILLLCFLKLWYIFQFHTYVTFKTLICRCSTWSQHPAAWQQVVKSETVNREQDVSLTVHFLYQCHMVLPWPRPFRRLEERLLCLRPVSVSARFGNWCFPLCFITDINGHLNGLIGETVN